MQVQCTFEREQVCAVVDAHNCAKPMGKERKPADRVQLFGPPNSHSCQRNHAWPNRFRVVGERLIETDESESN